MTPVNPWLMMQAGKALAHIVEFSAREEQERKKAQAKEQYEKEQQKLKKKMAREDEERKIKMLNPQATWLFEHFNFGNKYILYKTLY